MTVEGPGRGITARYPAFALWGLTRYPQAPFSEELKPGFEFSLGWLVKNRLKAGGWAAAPGGDFSFTVTMPAVHALDRLAFLPEYGKAASMLREQARRRVVGENRGTAAHPWWTPYGEGGQPSGAAT